jgi:hypothetical protein
MRVIQRGMQDRGPSRPFAAAGEVRVVGVKDEAEDAEPVGGP